MQPLLRWKSNKYEYYTTWACICSLRYPACNAYAPYCHLWPSPLYNIFPHYLNKAWFSKRKLLNIKYVFRSSLQPLSETFFILGRTERERSKTCIGLHVKYPLLLSAFNETCIISTDFRNILKYQILWKSLQWELECSMWTDGRMDRPDGVVVFRSFANAHSKGLKYSFIETASIEVQLLRVWQVTTLQNTRMSWTVE